MLNQLYEVAMKAKSIEIDLVDYCNMTCLNCVRGCNLKGESLKRGRLTLSNIGVFIHQSIALGIRWKYIKVVGGEPTLNPQVSSIVKLLREQYVDRFNPATLLYFYSNGVVKTPELTEEIKRYVSLYVDWYMYDNKQLYKSADQREYPQHYSVYVKPSDVGRNYEEVASKCDIPWLCGMGMSSRGFGICCNASNFMRIFDEQSEIRTLQDLLNRDKWIAQAKKYCSVCGIPFRIYKNVASKFWIDTFKERKIDAGELSLITELDA